MLGCPCPDVVSYTAQRHSWVCVPLVCVPLIISDGSGRCKRTSSFPKRLMPQLLILLLLVVPSIGANNGSRTAHKDVLTRVPTSGNTNARVLTNAKSGLPKEVTDVVDRPGRAAAATQTVILENGPMELMEYRLERLRNILTLTISRGASP